MAPFLVKNMGKGWSSPLLWILGVGAIVRLLFLFYMADLELRMDEVQYQDIAVNLTEGRGFALNGRLTSWRPPLYPFVMSIVYSVMGSTHPVVTRSFQALLSLVNGFIIYLLGRRLFGEGVGFWAAFLFIFDPSFLFYNNHILTEVVFTFLLILTAYCFVVYLESSRLSLLAALGITLGLGMLTRDTVWPMAGVVVFLVRLVRGPGFKRWGWHSAAVMIPFLVVVTPWVIRNTRLQGTFTLISPLPGIAFFAGNYEHTPLDRPWQYPILERGLRWRGIFPEGLTEGEQQRFAFRKGFEFIWSHPGLTLRRSVIKAANFWGLERGVVGVLLQGGYGNLRRSAVLAITGLIFGTYILTLLAGVTGLCFALAKPREEMGFHFHLFFAALVLFFTLAHAVAFGHPRYHLPLIPLFSVYAAHAWAIRHKIWEGRRSWTFKVPIFLAGVLLVIWSREVFFVEFERFIQGLTRR